MGFSNSLLNWFHIMWQGTLKSYRIYLVQNVNVLLYQVKKDPCGSIVGHNNHRALHTMRAR